MSRNRKPSIDPVILIALGLLLLTIAIVMLVFQSNTDKANIANNAGTASQLVVAFVTGLTTGGLSCLAVQGGLLASSLAHQIEQDFVERAAHVERKKPRSKKNQPAVHSSSAFPIFLFLIAKIVAYTLLGALLGLLGSYLTLSPAMRAIQSHWSAAVEVNQSSASPIVKSFYRMILRC